MYLQAVYRDDGRALAGRQECCPRHEPDQSVPCDPSPTEKDEAEAVHATKASQGDDCKSWKSLADDTAEKHYAYRTMNAVS
jgi:hypothetical protein